MSSFVNVECHVFIRQCVGFEVRNCYKLLNLDTWRSLGSAVIAAVVVELDPVARTGSHQSILTDDSRPSHTLAT